MQFQIIPVYLQHQTTEIMTKHELKASDKINIMCALENDIERLKKEVNDNSHFILNAVRNRRIEHLQEILDNIQDAVLIDLWKSDTNTQNI